MTKADTTRALMETADMLRSMTGHIDALYRRLAEYEGSIPSSSADSERVSVPGSASSPVERLAFRRDPAVAARRRLERLAHALHANAAEAHKIFTFWTVEPEREGAGQPAPGCTVMAQVGVWEPGAYTTAGGNLPERMLLGRWAADFVRRTGRLPTRAEAEARAQGRKVRAA